MIVRMWPLRTNWPKYLHCWNWCRTPSSDQRVTWNISPKWLHTWLARALPLGKFGMVSTSEQHLTLEANWQPILLYIITSISIKLCHSLQQKETVVGIIVLHIGRYKFWEKLPDWVRCQADLEENLPFDVSLARMKCFFVKDVLNFLYFRIWLLAMNIFCSCNRIILLQVVKCCSRRFGLNVHIIDAPTTISAPLSLPNTLKRVMIFFIIGYNHHVWMTLRYKSNNKDLTSLHLIRINHLINVIVLPMDIGVSFRGVCLLWRWYIIYGDGAALCARTIHFCMYLYRRKRESQ